MTVMLLGVGAGLLGVYPNQLAFFNTLAGGPGGGHRYLLHSSVGWGEDLWALEEWLKQHPEARPVGIELPVMWDPVSVGIPVKRTGDQTFRNARVRWYVLDATSLQRFGMLSPILGADLSEDDLADVLRSAELVGRVGASCYVFKYVDAR